MKKGKRPIELEDHDRTLGKGFEIGADRYDEDEIIDLDEIIEVDAGVLEDDEDFDLDVELIDLDADLDFDDLEPEVASSTGKQRGEPFLVEVTQWPAPSLSVDEPKAPAAQITVPRIEIPPAFEVKAQEPSFELKGPARAREPEVDPLADLLEGLRKGPAHEPEPGVKVEEPPPEVQMKEPDYFDTLLAAEMNRSLAKEPQPTVEEAVEKPPELVDAAVTAAAVAPAALAAEAIAPVSPAPAPAALPPELVAEPVVPPAGTVEVMAPIVSEPEVPAPKTVSPEPISEAQLEDLALRIESKLLEAVREIVEARLPGIVEAVLRDEIDRLKKELG